MLSLYYLVIQSYCYILIIPGFGIVSHVISTFTGKPVFGYIRSSLINLILLTQQTIFWKVTLFREMLLGTPL